MMRLHGMQNEKQVVTLAQTKVLGHFKLVSVL